jgi:hypothetical protein
MVIRIERKYMGCCTYPLKLTTHEKNARPYTLLRAVKMALSVAEENFGEATEATLFLFVNLLDISLPS